jgi:hypothetical protein
MNTFVLAPECAYAQLQALLSAAGWHEAGSASKPLIPGEPEHAVFERGGERVFYTFNPVCRLRVVDVQGAADRVAVMRMLPVVGLADVRDWLASQDERTVLRGILAAGVLIEPTLADAVAAHESHPRRAIADAALRTASALGRQRTAQAESLAAIEILRAQLLPLLTALTQDTEGHLTAQLRPRPGDAERVFVPEVAKATSEAYEKLWTITPPRIARASSGSRIACHLSPAGMLAEPNLLSREFSGGWRAVASLLQPQRVWAAWKVIELGKAAGMAYDGLVWVDDRWVWYPKPYRVMRSLVVG